MVISSHPPEEDCISSTIRLALELPGMRSFAIADMSLDEISSRLEHFKDEGLIDRYELEVTNHPEGVTQKKYLVYSPGTPAGEPYKARIVVLI
jgi:hypothetical protein